MAAKDRTHPARSRPRVQRNDGRHRPRFHKIIGPEASARNVPLRPGADTTNWPGGRDAITDLPRSTISYAVSGLDSSPLKIAPPIASNFGGPLETDLLVANFSALYAPVANIRPDTVPGGAPAALSLGPLPGGEGVPNPYYQWICEDGAHEPLAYVWFSIRRWTTEAALANAVAANGVGVGGAGMDPDASGPNPPFPGNLGKPFQLG